jgi:hypothetical protein
MCYCCKKNLTNEESFKYKGKAFCGDCISIINETIPKVQAVILQEEIIEKCLEEFA